MTDEEASELAKKLFGSTPEARRKSAQILVQNARLDDRPIQQWIVDVAEGRVPA